MSVSHWVVSQVYLAYEWFFVFGSSRFWTQGLTLVLARKVLNHLSHTPSPFCFSYFVLVILRVFARRWGLGGVSDHDPPTNTSHIAGITEVYPCPKLVGSDGVLLTFCPADLKYLALQMWGTITSSSRSGILNIRCSQVPVGLWGKLWILCPEKWLPLIHTANW
jgi:hypothetical protein